MKLSMKVMTMSKRIVISNVFLFFAFGSYAQELVWKADFDAQFDNREYKSEFSTPQTFFGARLIPELGIGWDNNRSGLFTGVIVIEEFGAETLEIDPELLLYYRYNTSKFSVFAGRFSRKQVSGKYSTAFFNDSVRFFDAAIDGVLFQYRGKYGYMEFACDWNSRQSETRREKFLMFSSGLLKKHLLYVGYNFSMYHHAMVAGGSGVTDNIWVLPYLGIDLAGKTCLDKLSLEAGWLQAFQNDRTYVGKYVSPGGVQIELQIEKRGAGIVNTLFRGENMMPYYERYGTGLYWGDSFYSTTHDVYDRLELYWKPLHRKDMDLKFSSVHHYDGKKWNWQQFVAFSVYIDNKLFAKKR